MSYFKDMVCIRCGNPMGSHAYYEGCPVCKAQGVGSNYTATYDLSNAKLPGANGQPGIYRYRDFYPLPDDAEPVSIGEGNTPLLHLKRLGEKLGIANLYVKDETRNPTLSYKDRICSLLVTKAKHDGAPAVTISSTGNHGNVFIRISVKMPRPAFRLFLPSASYTRTRSMPQLGDFAHTI